MCSAAGSPTGITDKNNQPVTLARRGPKAISTKWATPPALGNGGPAGRRRWQSEKQGG
jgi:hypothetical protein